MKEVKRKTYFYFPGHFIFHNVFLKNKHFRLGNSLTQKRVIWELSDRCPRNKNSASLISPLIYEVLGLNLEFLLQAAQLRLRDYTSVNFAARTILNIFQLAELVFRELTEPLEAQKACELFKKRQKIDEAISN